MVRVILFDKFVDLEAPIYMTERQRKEFVKGMKNVFGKENVITKEIIENKKELGDIQRQPRKFSDDDKILLATAGLTNEQIAVKLGKTPFAIQMRRGPFLMEVQEWAKRKGKTKITDKDILKFLGEEK